MAFAEKITKGGHALQAHPPFGSFWGGKTLSKTVKEPSVGGFSVVFHILGERRNFFEGFLAALGKLSQRVF